MAENIENQTDELEDEFLENEESFEESVAENDADIDRYIRELTGKPVEEPEEKEEPEVELYRVMSQIGEDDYRAFIFYSTLFRKKWTLPAYIIAPIVLSVLFAFDGGQFYSGNLILSLVVLYVALTLMVLIRCRSWVSKIKKKTPQVLHLTDTTIIFLTRSIVHLKNEKHAKVEYYHLVDLGETKKHFFLYFDSGKSMVFRKEDMPVKTFEAFKPFIQSKVHKKSYTNMIKR